MTLFGPEFKVIWVNHLSVLAPKVMVDPAFELNWPDSGEIHMGTKPSNLPGSLEICLDTL